MEIKMENEIIITIKKWRPVIEQLGLKNSYLINTICIFCEKFSIRESKAFTKVSDYNTNLPEKLREII